jgi:DNA-binding LacI/PurR family transcriptional regulator
VAHQRGYRPDPAISAIASSRWKKNSPTHLQNLAYVVNPRDRRYNVQISYLETAKRRGQELGYKIEIFNLSHYPSAKACSRVLHARGIRGLLVAPPRPHDKLTLNIEWEKFTAVGLPQGHHRLPLHYVTNDVFNSARLAWEKVYSAGYRRIGAAVYKHTPVAEDDFGRIGGCLAAREILPIQEKEYVPVLTSDHEDYDAFVEWYEKHRPEAIIAFTKRTHEYMEKAGIKVPRDCGLACLEVNESDEFYAGIRRTQDKIGEVAVELLINEIRENSWGIPAFQRAVYIEPVWKDGPSLSPRTPA